MCAKNQQKLNSHGDVRNRWFWLKIVLFRKITPESIKSHLLFSCDAGCRVLGKKWILWIASMGARNRWTLCTISLIPGDRFIAYKNTHVIMAGAGKACTAGYPHADWRNSSILFLFSEKFGTIALLWWGNRFPLPSVIFSTHQSSGYSGQKHRIWPTSVCSRPSPPPKVARRAPSDC